MRRAGLVGSTDRAREAGAVRAHAQGGAGWERGERSEGGAGNAGMGARAGRGLPAWMRARRGRCGTTRRAQESPRSLGLKRGARGAGAMCDAKKGRWHVGAGLGYSQTSSPSPDSIPPGGLKPPVVGPEQTTTSSSPNLTTTSWGGVHLFSHLKSFPTSILGRQEIPCRRFKTLGYA